MQEKKEAAHQIAKLLGDSGGPPFFITYKPRPLNEFFKKNPLFNIAYVPA